MHVTYDLTPDDFWHFSQYYLRHKHFIRLPLMYTWSAFMGLIFLGGLWIAADFWFTFGRTSWILLLGLLVLPFFAFRMFPPTKGRVIKAARQRPGLLCEHTISISPEWLSEKTQVNESKTAWATMKSLEEDPEYFYLFLDKLMAHTVPKRAFSSPREADLFMATARRYWGAAKTGQSVPTDGADIWPPPPRIGA